MATTTEPTVNTYVAQSLRAMHPRWAENGAVVSQSTDTLVGSRGKQPDILVKVPGAGPLVVEAEFIPARTLDADALSRIGETIIGWPGPVETVVALRYPERFRSVPESRLAAGLLAADDLQWCVWTEGPEDVRFPSQGWIAGGLADLAGTVETVAVSQRRIDQAADVLQDAVRQASVVLAAVGRPTQQKIADCLHQESGEQTMRMAASVVANAFLFQIAVAASHGTPSIAETQAASGDPRHLHKDDVLDAWAQILEVNYWPVFDIAVRLLRPIGEAHAEVLCDTLATAAARLAAAGVVEVQDLAGQMFGRLIADRKFLATFYTLPESAALLAELAVARLDGDVDWGDPEAVTSLRVADLACGTGALLSAVYRRIGARIRRAGLDDADLHAPMMQEALIGADIMPAAAHLTTTMLSAAHPAVGFGKCGIHVLPFGRTTQRSVAVGSLDLLADAGTLSLLGRPGTRLAGRGSEVEADSAIAACNVGDGTLDLCIMNPPFTRPTNHETAAAAGVPVPSFAGFGTSAADQKEMSRRLKVLSAVLGSDRAGHGNAGLASNFVDLAHAKLRPGGVLALVLPFASIAGGSWEGMRRLLDKHYTGVTVASIATHGATRRSFSADTGMAEIALIARKRPEALVASKTSSVSWPSLARRPRSITDAVEVARAIDMAIGSPMATQVEVGDDRVGFVLSGRITDGGLAAIAEPDVTRAALGLMEGVLRLARREDIQVTVARLGEIGGPGPVHRDVNGTDKNTRQHRGPFDIEPLERGKTASYPVLWAHDAGSGRESQIEVSPDRQGRVRLGMTQRALYVWATATRLHLSLDFQLNSQPLSACVTPESCIGGRAWPSFVLEDRAWEQSVALWLNTTLGLVGFWWVSTRQQQGRANLTVSRLSELVTVDPRKLSPEQAARAGDIFDLFKDRPMLPANEAYRDEVRQELDEAVLCNLLGFSTGILVPLGILRSQWCEEPSVHGGKGTRPLP